MTVLDTLTDEQKAKLEDAQNQLTVEMLEALKYGEEKELNDTITLYHYCEEDIIVLNLTEGWEEVLQILWNHETRSDIEYEVL